MILRDLDELVQSCRDQEARSYIAEAVICYKAGAFRACIVATWIAVVFDLIAKIRELSLSGDAEARRIIEDLTTWQPLIERGDTVSIRKSLELEREIVNLANDNFGFFDGIQVLDLKRLQDDRNRCAHPSFQGSDQPYSPSSELARTHLVHAVKHVLSQPPVQGKAATEHVLKSVKSQFFPTELEGAKTQLRSAGLERPKDSLVRSVTDHLLFGMLEGDRDLKGRRQTAAAIRALYELYPGHSEPRIRRALNTICRRMRDGDLPLIFGLNRFFPQTWDFLEADNRQKLIEMVRQSSDETAVIVLPIALQINDLDEVCATRIARLDRKELGEVLKKNPHPVAIRRAVDIYCSSKSWDGANTNYEHVIEPILDKLNQEQIRRILLASETERADLPGSHSFSNFTKYVYESEKLPKKEVIETLKDHGMGYMAERLEPADADGDDDGEADIPF